jgi:hypothetical protein
MVFKLFSSPSFSLASSCLDTDVQRGFKIALSDNLDLGIPLSESFLFFPLFSAITDLTSFISVT